MYWEYVDDRDERARAGWLYSKVPIDNKTIGAANYFLIELEHLVGHCGMELVEDSEHEFLFVHFPQTKIDLVYKSDFTYAFFANPRYCGKLVKVDK